MADGTTLTKDNLDDWIKELIPPRGVPRDDEDGSVWNWTIDALRPGEARLPGRARGDRELAEPAGRGRRPPRALPGDEFVGDRPKILFNPEDGRVAYPLLRPNIGQRPPLTPERALRHAVPRQHGDGRVHDATSRTRGPAARTASARRTRRCASSTSRRSSCRSRSAARAPTRPARSSSSTRTRTAVLRRRQAGRAARHPGQRRRLRRAHARDGVRAGARRRPTARSPTCTSTTCSSTRRAPTARAPAWSTTSRSGPTSSSTRS